MRVEAQPAYILHQRPYRDTSQILEIFSRDHGRLSVMSRGSRAARSRLRGILQPFRPLVLSWSGRGEMPSLSKAEPTPTALPLLQQKPLTCALYINELIMYLTHRHDVHIELFAEYHQALGALSACDNLEVELRRFEIRLLQTLGFALNLQYDADHDKPLQPDADYLYYLEHGPVLLMEAPPQTAIPVVKGRSLLAMASGELNDEDILRDAKRVMRFVLSHHLGGRSLRSRELFRP